MHNLEMVTVNAFDYFLCLFLVNIIPTCRSMLYTEFSLLLVPLIFFLCFWKAPQIYSLNPSFNFLQCQLWYSVSPMLILICCCVFQFLYLFTHFEKHSVNLNLMLISYKIIFQRTFDLLYFQTVVSKFLFTNWY